MFSNWQRFKLSGCFLVLVILFLSPFHCISLEFFSDICAQCSYNVYRLHQYARNYCVLQALISGYCSWSYRGRPASVASRLFRLLFIVSIVSVVYRVIRLTRYRVYASPVKDQCLLQFFRDSYSKKHCRIFSVETLFIVVIDVSWLCVIWLTLDCVYTTDQTRGHTLRLHAKMKKNSAFYYHEEHCYVRLNKFHYLWNIIDFNLRKQFFY